MKQLHKITCIICGTKKEITGKIPVCSPKCACKEWRSRNQKGAVHRKYNVEKICGWDGQRRDNRKDWLKYMAKNPLYLECLGIINFNRIGI